MDVGRTGVENWKPYYTAANQLFKNVKTTRFCVPKYIEQELPNNETSKQMQSSSL